MAGRHQRGLEALRALQSLQQQQQRQLKVQMEPSSAPSPYLSSTTAASTSRGEGSPSGIAEVFVGEAEVWLLNSVKVQRSAEVQRSGGGGGAKKAPIGLPPLAPSGGGGAAGKSLLSSAGGGERGGTRRSQRRAPLPECVIVGLM
jgi:hypothetical protein